MNDISQVIKKNDEFRKSVFANYNPHHGKIVKTRLIQEKGYLTNLTIDNLIAKESFEDNVDPHFRNDYGRIVINKGWPSQLSVCFRILYFEDESCESLAKCLLDAYRVLNIMTFDEYMESDYEEVVR